MCTYVWINFEAWCRETSSIFEHATFTEMFIRLTMLFQSFLHTVYAFFKSIGYFIFLTAVMNSPHSQKLSFLVDDWLCAFILHPPPPHHTKSVSIFVIPTRWQSWAHLNAKRLRTGDKQWLAGLPKKSKDKKMVLFWLFFLLHKLRTEMIPMLHIVKFNLLLVFNLQKQRRAVTVAFKITSSLFMQ